MKPQLTGNHPSYQNHRRQFWAQIFLPLILAVIIVIAVAVLTGIAAFGSNGDAPRWAAISTIWLVIPVMAFGLLFFVILAGLVYLLTQALKTLPPYTSKAQYYVKRGASEIKRYSDKTAEPVLFIEGIKASIRAFLDGIRKGIL